MDERSRHRQFEDQFHRQLRARAQALLHRGLPADRVVVESMPDGVDTVRSTLTRLERFDRDLLEQLPGTRAVQMRFQRRVLGGLFARTIARVRAQVLSPLEALIADEPPGPVGREQVLDALARYELLPQRARPTAVVFASATGFTPEAQSLVNVPGPPTVMLLGGREDGGWDVAMPDKLRRSPWAGLLEFESQDDRLKRLLYHLDQSAMKLDSQGIPLPELAERLGLSLEQTEALVRRACRTDSRLLTVVHDSRIHICRSPLGEESNRMNIWSWIRKVLRLKPTVAERVRAMTAQRVAIEQQRHEIDEKTGVLEAEEREAIQQGAAAKSAAERKQVAGRLMRVRRNLRRLRSQATVFTQQIDILGTHIHNLTLAEQGRRMELPKAEDLTREAAEAEGVVSELAANAELAAGIEVGAQTPAMADEEAAILAEFEQVAQREAQTQPAAETAPAAPEGPEKEDTEAAAEPPADTKEKDAADPELS